MLTEPATFLVPALLAWLLMILTGKSAPSLRAYSKRSLLWLLLLTALASSALNASPFGPYQPFATAARNLVILYPAWLILSVLWLLPGIVLCRRYRFSPIKLLPLTAMTIELTLRA